MNKIVNFFESKHGRRALRIYAALFPLFLFLALEWLNPASTAGLFANIWQGIGSLLTSVLMLALAALWIYAIVGSVLWAYGILSVILLVIYVVNHFKLMIAGGVFVPTDIFLAGAAFQVMEFEVVAIRPSLVFGILLVILLNVPLYFFKMRLPFSRRIITLPVTVVLFLVFFTGSFAVNRVFPLFGLNEGTVTDRYRDHGLVLGFYSELVRHLVPVDAEAGEEHLFLLAPNRHSTENVHRPFDAEGLTVDMMDTRRPAEPEPEPVIPNVIVIMSEAFMDPTIFDNISFSQYPVPQFRRLSQSENALTGGVVVPVFGGGTAATELEFLAGTPHVFFGSRMYLPHENPSRYFSRPIPSAMPWLFRENGYRAVAVHPFYGDFFNRNQIMPLLGFETFIALEDMPDARRRGQFVSDEYFTDRIIEQILLAEEDGVPLFLFGISMQNHWGFEPGKFGSLPLAVQSESPYLTEDGIARMDVFLQGIFDADKQLGRLADFVESRETPTIIVFFGDHLPLLGRHQDRVFERLGFISHQDEFNWTLADRQQIFQTPYLVWANYDINTEEWGVLSTYMLGARVAQASGITLNRFFTYTLGGLEHFRAFNNALYVDTDGVFHPGWMFRNRPYIQALEALWNAKFHGSDDLHRSLADLME